MENKQERQLLDLPEEVLLGLLSYLYPEDLCIVTRVCKRLRALADENSLWRPFCGSLDAPPRPCKEVYMEWLRDVIPAYRNPPFRLFHKVDNPTEVRALLKILIVGDLGAGKTCVKMRFEDGYFTPHFISTLGLSFKVTYADVDSYRYKIWDTAGQERFQTITVAYYRGANGIILVYDTTNEESIKNLPKWINQIREHSTPAAIVLIGAKADLNQEIKHQADDIAFRYGLPHLLTSAKDNINVTEAFETLIRTIVKNSSSPSLVGGAQLKRTPAYVPSPSVLERMGIRYGDKNSRGGEGLNLQSKPKPKSNC